MPILTQLAKDVMVDAITVASIGLHTAYSTTGGFEVVGGTPAYARVAVTFAPSSFGFKILSATPYFIDVPACTVAWIGMYDGSGTFLGMVPNGGDTLRPFTANTLVANTLQSANHGLSAFDTVVLWNGFSSAHLPTVLFEGIVYNVINATADTFQISLTPGGDIFPIPTSGNGYVQRISSAVFAAQNQYELLSLVIDSNVAA